MRERLVSGGEEPEDRDLEMSSLRPRALEEYIGQREIIRPLRIALEAARRREEPLDHVLLHGPPGLGKTTLAHIIRQEMDVNIQITSGPALRRPGDLMGLLTNLQKGDVFFIDEIHRLDATVEEYLYPAMEDFTVDFVLDRGANARMLNFKLRQFTLVGATTMTGLLSGPLRGRFGLTYHLDYYHPDDLRQIVLRSAGILQVPIEEAGADEIARRSRGTPRIANRLLKRVRDYAQVEGNGVITQRSADAALRLEGIDQLGLDRLDRELMRVVIETYQGGPVGIEALAATLNEEQTTLVEVVEPYLLKIGFLARTPSGRRATHLAYRHLGIAEQGNTGQGRLGL
jgi:holliday junction DNA helicase RuvB